MGAAISSAVTSRRRPPDAGEAVRVGHDVASRVRGVWRLWRPHSVELFGCQWSNFLNGGATLGDEAIDAIAITGGHDAHGIWHNESERRRQSR